MKKSILFLLLLCLAFASTYAQNSKKFLEQFKKGKNLLQNAKYPEAKQAFLPLLKPQKNNIYVEYAHYYTALASFKQKRYDEAESLLSKLSKTFPKWEAMDEAEYLLANIAFERKEDNIGLAYIEQIKKVALYNDANEMKGFYLSKRDVQTLRNLNVVYPKDQFIAQILVDKLATKADNLNDLDEIEALVKKHSLERPAKIRIERKEKKKNVKNANDTVTIALMMPIDIKNFNKENISNTTTQISLDFYQGMRMAKRQLDSSGFPIRLRVYDLNEQKADTLNVWDDKGDFDKIDMFVGSFGEKSFDNIIKIAEDKQICVVSPFFMYPKYTNHDLAYFSEPTSQTQGVSTALFARKKFGKKVVIFYVDSPEEKKIAEAHKKQVEKEGGDVLEFQKLAASTISEIDKVFASNKAIDYVFVAGSSQAGALEIMQQMKDKHPKTPILASIGWRKFQNLQADDFERQNVHFIDPDYTTLSGTNFKEAYNYYVFRITKIGYMKNPSVAAHQGYDFMMTFGKLLSQKQSHIEQYISDYEGFKKTFRGYQYTENRHDNQFVPILKYQDKKLILANPLN